MPFEVIKKGERTSLTLSGRIGVRDARQLWTALASGADAERGLLLDAERVEDMDTSIVQILCRLDARLGRVSIVRASEGFRLSLKRRGLEVFFAPTEPGQQQAPLRLERRRTRIQSSRKATMKMHDAGEQDNG